jgi:transcription-repair coupling factor (superfamily II helicase)
MQEIKLKPGALSHTDLSSKLTLAVEDSRVYNQLQSALTREKPVSVTGLPGTLCAVLLTTIANSQPLIVVTADSRRSEELLDDLYLLLSEDDVCFLPPAENTKLRRMLPEAVNHHRAETLRKLASSPPKIMLILPGTLTEKFPSLEALKNRTLHLKIGSEIEPYELVKRLLNAGFRREIQVAGCGETALRGGILDLFPYGFKHPLRLEFWGNEISSIRLFDPRSQLSIKEITEVEVFIEKRQDLSVSVFSLMDGIVFWDDMNAIRERYRVLSASLTDPLDLVKANHISIIHNTLEKGDINFRGSTPDLLLGSAPAFKN